MHNDKLFFWVQSFIKYNSFDWGIYLRSFLYRPFFRSFGKNIRIKDGVTFKYPSEIALGDNCIIGEFSYFVGKGGLTIGENALLAAGTKIITSRHNYDVIDVPMKDQGLTFESIEIGSDVWTGFDVKIFGGTRIGNGVIVGANSMVKDINVPDHVILAGTPAKIIKTRN